MKLNSEKRIWCQLGVLFSSIDHLPGRAAPSINTRSTSIYQHLPSTRHLPSTTIYQVDGRCTRALGLKPRAAGPRYDFEAGKWQVDQVEVAPLGPSEVVPVAVAIQLQTVEPPRGEIFLQRCEA